MIKMNKDVDKYIEKQRQLQKEICRKLRKIIFKTFPDIEEKMKWGVPSYGNGKYNFVALKTHVNQGFSLEGLSKKEQKLFEGGGKTMKHAKVFSLKEINEKEITKLFAASKEIRNEKNRKNLY